MSSTPKFAHCDTKRPDGFYVQFTRVIEHDDDQTPPDERMDGYWPSLDPNDAGYIGKKSKTDLAKEHDRCKRKFDAWKRGEWGYIGVRARALCLIVRKGVGTYINLDSAGLWGIEEDAGSYLDEVYRDEIDNLKTLIAEMHDPIYEGTK